MKRPTLRQLIETSEKEVNVDDWYRREKLLQKFHGLSKSSLDVYQREMEDIPEFSEGVLKPGHSTTFINYHAFVWYLRWKEANRYRSRKISPQEVLNGK